MECRENGFTDPVCSDFGEKGGGREIASCSFFFFVAYSERPLWLSFLLSLLDEMIACLWTMVFFVGRHDVTTFCLQILFSLS